MDGRHYRQLAPGVLVTRAPNDQPPSTWHVSTPNPNDATGRTRWYWLFLPIAALVAAYLLTI